MVLTISFSNEHNKYLNILISLFIYFYSVHIPQNNLYGQINVIGDYKIYKMY
jgi:hypothetical protein